MNEISPIFSSVNFWNDLRKNNLNVKNIVTNSHRKENFVYFQNYKIKEIEMIELSIINGNDYLILLASLADEPSKLIMILCEKTFKLVMSKIINHKTSFIKVKKDILLIHRSDNISGLLISLSNRYRKSNF